VAESNDSERPRALIGIVRSGNEPIPDSEIDHVLRWICEHGGQHEPPRDLADETLDRLERGDAPRGVAEWLRGQLRERYDATPSWLSFLLDTTPQPRPTREQALRQLDEVERREGSSKALREARRFLIEQPDDAFGSE
jgi:hypothetical protein